MKSEDLSKIRQFAARLGVKAPDSHSAACPTCPTPLNERWDSERDEKIALYQSISGSVPPVPPVPPENDEMLQRSARGREQEERAAFIAERAAIREFEGGVTRAEAERLALADLAEVDGQGLHQPTEGE